MSWIQSVVDCPVATSRRCARSTVHWDQRAQCCHDLWTNMATENAGEYFIGCEIYSHILCAFCEVFASYPSISVCYAMQKDRRRISYAIWRITDSMEILWSLQPILYRLIIVSCSKFGCANTYILATLTSRDHSHTIHITVNNTIGTACIHVYTLFYLCRKLGPLCLLLGCRHPQSSMCCDLRPPALRQLCASPTRRRARSGVHNTEKRTQQNAANDLLMMAVCCEPAGRSQQ